MRTHKTNIAARGGHLQDAAAELIKVGADAQLDVGGRNAAGRQAPPQHWQQRHVGLWEVEHGCRHLALHRTPTTLFLPQRIVKKDAVLAKILPSLVGEDV